MSQLSTKLQVLIQLLQRDWYIFKQVYLHRVRMCLYWLLLTTFASNMFMPAMGLQNFGPFILIGSVISYGFFITMQNAIGLVEDITGNQAILYELSLPIPQWMIFLKFAITNMMQSFIISLTLLPFGLLVLMNPCPFPDFSFIKFITIFICSSIFYGSFGLIFTSVLKSMRQIDNVWLRIIFPMWYLGCWQFSWKTLYNVSPTLAYLDLLNPLTLIIEAGRSATTDNVGSLPFWPCCIVTLIYAAISCFVGIYWMKKRLDCL
ncbi:MAG: ABC transporter permease [Candidatus Dependentiae bacterium]|nr:ABC transporter permease [Candidatus Dependentiae bacterium]